MSLFVRRLSRLLLGLALVGVLAVACTSAAGVSSDAPDVPDPNEPGGTMTINVTVTDDGYQTPSIFIPVGRGVRLVLRNHGTTEHHYRAVGLVPQDLQWLAGPEDVRIEGVTEEEHESHHATGFMPFRVASPAGIKPIGDEVHAYAPAGEVDVVLFIPTNTGVFQVQCPLHPELIGKVTVF